MEYDIYYFNDWEILMEKGMNYKLLLFKDLLLFVKQQDLHVLDIIAECKYELNENNKPTIVSVEKSRKDLKVDCDNDKKTIKLTTNTH